MPASLFALILGATIAAASATETTLTGDWKVRNEVAGNVSEMTCTFTQKQSELTGKCVSDATPNGVEISGSVDQAAVSWVYRATYEGNPITLTYRGTFEEGSMRGTLTVEEFNVSGEFSGTPIKK